MYFYILTINYLKINSENNIIDNRIESKKILRNKLNQGAERKTCTLKTMKDWWRKSKRVKINGKIFHAQRLEDLILLKCPYYPKWSAYSIQSLPLAFFFFSELEKQS